MRDFSIDLQSEKIYSPKTKKYFEEVIKSYHSESYRSAIVMLYSIAIADLLFKLEELKNVFEDDSAKKILAKVDKAKENRNHLSEWESTLVEEIKIQTNLLAPEDHHHLTSLRDLRHLCAHPVITEHYELYHPSRESVRAHIRNMLEGILTKPAILSKKVVNNLIEELASRKKHLIDDKKLETFLKDRYFKRFNNKLKELVFRSLWKFIFKLNDEKTNQNRGILYRAFSLLLKDNYTFHLNSIETEKDYYSDIDDYQFFYAANLFNRYPQIYEKLNDTIKIIFQAEAQRSANFNAYCIFFSPDISSHIENVLSLNIGRGSTFEDNNITPYTINEVAELLHKNHRRDEAYNFLIEMFGRSVSFAQADERYEWLIKPYLEFLSHIELQLVLDKFRENGQIGYRRDAATTRNEVVGVLRRRFDIELV